MNIKTDPNTGALTVSGGIHTNAVRPLKDALLAHLSNSNDVVVDMTGVDMCDTASLQVLHALRRTAAELGKPCRIAASAEMRETVQALGFPVNLLEEVGSDGR